MNDPKRRHIHKAGVTDRVLHHLLYTYLYELFDPTFIYDSYSCRLNKGSHKGVERLVTFTRKASTNYTKDCWGLQFDVKQFFASADHEILKQLLAKRVSDTRILMLLSQVIDSFYSPTDRRKGIPLGNLTSQIFANIYLHELDMYMKHTLKARFYIRYADDGIVAMSSREKLEQFIPSIEAFLQKHLLLSLHANKVTIRKLSWGIDFLGYIVLPHYVLPRTTTKRRLLKRIQTDDASTSTNQMIQSYLGYLAHAQTYRLRILVKHMTYRTTTKAWAIIEKR